MPVSNVYVALMGMGTVFFGLICIVILCKIVSAVMKTGEKPKEVKTPGGAQAAPAVAQPATQAQEAVRAVQADPARQELIAASCVAIAEMEGVPVDRIRVTKFQRYGEVTGAERGVLLAAACTAIAESLGTGLEQIRVHSFRRVG